MSYTGVDVFEGSFAGAAAEKHDIGNSKFRIEPRAGKTCVRGLVQKDKPEPSAAASRQMTREWSGDIVRGYFSTEERRWMR